MTLLWPLIKKFLFLFPPEWAHAIGASFLKLLGFANQGRGPAWVFRRHYSLKTDLSLGGKPLGHPVGLAAGFDKNAQLVLGARALGFSFVEVGTVTPLPQRGNPSPRLFRLPEAEALINRLGFNNQGASVVAARLERLRALHSIHFPIGVNIGKNKEVTEANAASDYARATEIIAPFADYLVVNLSSPNTPGLTDLQTSDAFVAILKAVRHTRDQLAKKSPNVCQDLLVKLSPDLSDEQAAQAAQQALANGFTGLILSNTSRSRDLPGCAAANAAALAESGGLSGPPLRALALARLRQLRALLGPKPLLISCGGLAAKEDARERMLAGASLLQVYTALVYRGPGLVRQLTR
jgi:dihydroorotate dehydrogenase